MTVKVPETQRTSEWYGNFKNWEIILQTNNYWLAMLNGPMPHLAREQEGGSATMASTMGPAAVGDGLSLYSPARVRDTTLPQYRVSQQPIGPQSALRLDQPSASDPTGPNRNNDEAGQAYIQGPSNGNSNPNHHNTNSNTQGQQDYLAGLEIWHKPQANWDQPEYVLQRSLSTNKPLTCDL